ncbi:MAG: tetratricopeptide repeat protein [Armatimonadetes bacterium]|nr:tetratricopeptide repeat protein [Armatimonadota bacterium]
MGREPGQSAYEELMERGREFARQLEFPSAAEIFRQALELAGETTAAGQARNELARCCCVLGSWADAENCIESVLREPSPAPEQARAWLLRGELMSMKGDPEETARSLQFALELAIANRLRELTVEARCCLAEHAGRTGAVEESRALIEAGLDELEELEPGPSVSALRATLLTQLGLYHFRCTRLRLAEEKALEALRTLEGTGPSLTQANVQRYLGVITGLRRKHRTALTYHLGALDIFKQAGHRYGQAKIYESIGRSFLALNRMEEAVFSFRKCEQLCLDLGAHSELATLYGKLGQVYMLREDYETAADYFRRDLDLSNRFRNHYALGYSHRNLGQCLVQLGCLDDAIGSLSASLALFERVGDAFNLARVRMDLCHAYIRKGDGEKARGMGEEARALFEDHEMRKELDYLEALSGSVARLQGDPEEAGRRLRSAIERLGVHGPSSWLAESYYELGVLERQRSDRPAAVDALKNAVRVARQAGLTRETSRFLQELEDLDERELFLTWMEGLEDRKTGPASMPSASVGAAVGGHP